ncbi:hypothetical protein DFH11DRAFT_1730604 [Phellopilus nigrolimitatus]|nr:hypothetical protein DFH11DRAFT_1730604 [Phellopilus nigrolimitatus]
MPERKQTRAKSAKSRLLEPQVRSDTTHGVKRARRKRIEGDRGKSERQPAGRVFHLPTLLTNADTGKSVDETDAPSIHPALGIWPGDHVPRLYWDLSLPEDWVYKRPITEEEMEAYPVLPQQESMLILFDVEHKWTIPLEPRIGYDYMTLRCFREALGASMQQPIQLAVWNTASITKKMEIVRAFYRRTGVMFSRPDISLVIETFRTWEAVINNFCRHGVAFDDITQGMDEYVTCGAEAGYTKLQTIDLFGHNFMFWGLEFAEAPNVWELKTTSRSLARMAHHLLPGLNADRRSETTQMEEE